MSRILKLAIFAAVALAQLGVPAWMIGQREWILRNGTPYKFRTAPVDPYDAFRGKYIWLNFDETTANWPGPGPVPNEMFSRESGVYATLTTGPNGFAKFGTVSLEPPKSGDYLRVDIARYWSEDSSGVVQDRVRVILPFDRYYMNEAMAPAAEEAYRANSRRDAQNTYAIIRVRKGQGVLESVHIGNQRIEDFITKPNEAR